MGSNTQEIYNIVKAIKNKEISDDVAQIRILRLISVSNIIATEYAEFCVHCDRKGLPLISLEDYIEQYCC